MSEIIIDDRGIYFDRRIGISRQTALEAIDNPQHMAYLYDTVKQKDCELDIDLAEFTYFMNRFVRP